MMVSITWDERYPIYRVAGPEDTGIDIPLTQAELEDLQRVTTEFEVWQERLERAHDAARDAENLRKTPCNVPK